MILAEQLSKQLRKGEDERTAYSLRFFAWPKDKQFDSEAHAGECSVDGWVRD